MVTTLINIILFENLVSVCTARVKREICEPTFPLITSLSTQSQLDNIEREII